MYQRVSSRVGSITVTLFLISACGGSLRLDANRLFAKSEGKSAAKPGQPASVRQPALDQQHVQHPGPGESGEQPLAPTPAPPAGSIITLSNQSKPHAQVHGRFDLRIGDYLSETKYQDCGRSRITSELVPFVLTEPITGLNVRLQNGVGDTIIGSAIVVFPDGSHRCSDANDEVQEKNWPAGNYQVFFTGVSASVRGYLKFEVPTRTRRELKETLASIPDIHLDAKKANPFFTTLSLPAVSTDAAEVGLQCVDKRRRVSPLARVVAATSADYKIRQHLATGLAKQSLVLATEQGECVDASDLATGKYTLWAVLNPKFKSPKVMDIEVMADMNPLVFPAAPNKSIGSLAHYKIFGGKVNPPQYWGRRSSFDGMCSGAARAPDFYLTPKKSIRNVELSVLSSGKPVRLHVFGPTREAKVPQCGTAKKESFDFETFEGKYAVWVGSPTSKGESTGQSYNVMVRRNEVHEDSMTEVVPVPQSLAVKHRTITNYFPFFASHSLGHWFDAFTMAPEQLFVYAATNFTDDDVAIQAGEPLLVRAVYASTDELLVARYDGAMASAKRKQLSGARPNQVTLPVKPSVPHYDRLGGAIGAAGPEDKKKIAAYEKRKDKYTNCFLDYQSDHDPTLRTGHEVYARGRSGNVVNVGDQVASRAFRRCKGAAFERAGETLSKALAKTRAKRYQAHLLGIRERFGL